MRGALLEPNDGRGVNDGDEWTTTGAGDEWITTGRLGTMMGRE
jgi:hypothetical protein